MARLVGDRLVSRSAARDADSEGMFVTALLEDREGSIWVATRHGGLHQLRDVPFQAITRREGLAHDDVLSVFEDHAGQPVGRHRRRRPDPAHAGDKSFTWTIEEGLPSNIIWTLAETRDGAIWVGTPRGLARIFGGRVTSFAGVDGYPPGGIRAILEDRHGNLWIGRPQRPVAPPRQRGQALHQGERSGLSSNNITVLREGRDGHALDRHDRRRPEPAVSAAASPTTRPSRGCAATTSPPSSATDQHVWVGTLDGSLHLVRNDRVLALPTRGGVSSGHALQILDDERGSHVGDAASAASPASSAAIC